jgi:hypothetical protein
MISSTFVYFHFSHRIGDGNCILILFYSHSSSEWCWKWILYNEDNWNYRKLSYINIYIYENISMSFWNRNYLKNNS